MSGMPPVRHVMVDRRRLAGIWIAVAVLLAGGCDDGTTRHTTKRASGLPATPTSAEIRKTVRLPPKAFPRRLAFSSNGELWVTETSVGAIARIDPNGRVSQYRIPGQSSDPSNIIAGPDGQMWFTGMELVGRVDSTGHLTGWEDLSIGLPNALVVGPDGAVWYTNESVPPRLTRISTAGGRTSIVVESGSAGVRMNGIAAGQDGALWFSVISVDESVPPAIGRATTNGEVTMWPLPPRSDPQELIAGPGGDLWFTEAEAIGRISTTGAISAVPVPDGARPRDIESGRDGALWFTTDTTVGRVTASGTVGQWPVPGAAGLSGIVSAPDGSLWIADSQASAVMNVAIRN